MKNHHFIGLPTEIQVRKFAAEKNELTKKDDPEQLSDTL